jgi:glucosamine 6-phosphate synthetase-like amidotransferase/phosphosugar isomerase protein
VKLLIPWLLLNWQSDIRILAFVMLWGSSFERNTCRAYTHAGPEIGVASTKAFTTNHSVDYDCTSFSQRKRTLSHLIFICTYN